jgi:hypothetical protein
MSTWYSFVGGMEKVTPGTYEDAASSAKRQPMARITSASRQRALPVSVPLEPG